MMDWINSLVSAAMDSLSQGSYTALTVMLLVAALTEIGVPFPFIIDGAILLTSYESGIWSLHLLSVILALILGRVLGAAAIFYASRLAGRAFLKWLSKRIPFLKIETRMASINQKIRRSAVMMVALVRLTPGLLTPSSVAAGYSGIRFYQFVLGIILASVIADGSLVLVGITSRYGLSFSGYSLTPWEIILGLVLLIGLAWLIRYLWIKRHWRRALEQVMKRMFYWFKDKANTR
jgi:membrane protein DedA with SNARE-associated domain